MTDYLKDHPGGDAILKQAGKDATEAFGRIRAHSIVNQFIKQLLDKYYIGEVAE